MWGGGDGIALDIDDAGPTFSALANDLLLACYGPRFNAGGDHAVGDGEGELREDFDIIVHDGVHLGWLAERIARRHIAEMCCIV